MKKTNFVLLISLLLSACTREEINSPSRVVGYRPVYSRDPSIFLVENKPAQAVTKAGKIYVKDNYIFQNEIGEGIHIIDNTVPASAARIGFIKILGSEELAIKGNFLYTNNFTDLVVIDISNMAAVREVNRIRNAFNQQHFQLAPPANGYFECVDKSKGTVIAWISDTLNDPKCSK